MKESIRRGHLKLTYDNAVGTYSIEDTAAKRVVLDGAVAGVKIAGRKKRITTNNASSIDIHRENSRLAATHRFDVVPCVLTLVFEGVTIGDTPAFTVALSIENKSESAISGIDFFPLILERRGGAHLFGYGGKHGYSFLRNGFLTWSCSGTKRDDERLCGPRLKFVHDMTENSTVAFPPARGHFIGECFGAVREADGSTIVVGFTTIKDQLSQVSFKSRYGFFHHLRAVSHGENNKVSSGDTLNAEEFLIVPRLASGDDSATLLFDTPLKAYAARAAAKTPPPSMPANPVGWCSWYYYFHDMTEKVILQNLEAAKELKNRLPIDVFQVDDGYQPAPGDWLETTKKFPHGMLWLANKIRGAGFRPGIWLAPFMATGRSRLFREHPGWFVKNKKGKPRWTTFWTSPYAFGSVYCLDTTHPEVIRWLNNTFDTIVNKWGFEYLKLDFLYAGAIDGVRYDSDATRAQAFRRGLEAIREAVGDDTYILGCGVPLGPALGIVNGARIAGDTSPSWDEPLVSDVIGHKAAPGVPNAARVMFARYFMHRRWFLGDPDCLMSRFDDTKLSADEVLTHAACVAMAGGALFISDNLAALGESGVALAQKLIPPVDTPAVPVDLFDSDIAATLVLPFDRDYDSPTVVARFNWSSYTADLPVYFDKIGLAADTEYHVYELWEDRYYGRNKGMITLPRVPGHASRMLSLRPVRDVPHVVASTFHFTQGGVDMTAQNYDARKRALDITFSLPGQRRGRVYLCIPRGYSPMRATINRTHETIPIKEQNDYYYIEFDMDGETHLCVEFEQD